MGGHRAHAVFTLVLLSLTTVPALAANILVNGNFDAVPTGTGWVQDDGGSGYPLIVPGGQLPPNITPHSPPNAVWLGGIPNGADAVYQDVTVPPGAGRLTLSGYLRIVTDELFFGLYDHMYAEIIGPGAPSGGIELLHQWSNMDVNQSWAAFSLQASGNYAGQTVRVRFRSTNDASYATDFLIDTCILDATSTVAVALPSAPATSRLSAARPNPTRGAAHLNLDLSAPGLVHAGIYDMEGRLIHDIDDEFLAAGSHDLRWDGTDASGAQVAPGVYVCRADVGGHSFHQTIALIR